MVAEKIAMKELGIERARHFGWTNTYVFTKAMGEMLLGQLRGSLPLVIARPTMITSTWKEPFPGWIEGNGTIDNVIVGYAKGILPCIAIDSELPIDLIPGDMAVNAMIAMAVAHSNQQAEFIYHISSSMLRLVNCMLCLFPKKYSNLSQRYGYAMRIVDLYRPYCFVKRCFDDTNLDRLRMETKKHTENLIFYFDPKDIDWEEYFYNTHIPGAVKYAAADSVGNIQQLHPIIMDRKSKL
ncbi:hypothetical protein IEQ34_012900 [Dendrobium chrysotoxum]|uniref:Fatty acyl-CoA reductase n=1 Tax=Dendrobium chrysotoxum TaxID=161865 RepID=A0AAV7GN25_DENCH|nr:hypothetical protein IEQ34_012900 [Dendrobium chrysotoxum]